MGVIRWHCPLCETEVEAHVANVLSGPQCPCAILWRGSATAMEIVAYDSADCGDFKIRVVPAWE